MVTHILDLRRASDVGEPLGRLTNPRAWPTLTVFAVAWWLTPIVMPILQQPLGMLVRPGPMPPHTLHRDVLTIYTLAYLVWSLVALSAVALALGRSPLAFPVRGPDRWRRGGIGLATGLALLWQVEGTGWSRR